MRGLDQGAHSLFGIRLFAQHGAYLGVAERDPDAVAEQQKTFALAQLTFQVIDHQVLIQAQRTFEYMLHTGLVPDVVFADALQLPGMPAIDPAVANVGEGKALAAQDQGAEGRQQRLAAAIGLQPAILCQQQAVQRLGHAPGFRGRVVIQGQGLQARARGQATVGALADAVRQGEQIAFAGSEGRRRCDQAQGVLVFWARAGGAGLGVAQLQAHGIASDAGSGNGS
ncbi:hypothetical protein D3C85_589410 [compost metagenome]